MIDIQEKKGKIVSFIEENGPSLPVRIAKTINMDPVFASAILSELLSTKKIKMSHLKVGSSSLYLIPGQEQRLEEHADNLKSIEKDVMLKLQREKVLVDKDEEPATRVALRSIKDFAVPFKFQDQIMWRYAFTPKEEIKELLSPTTREEPKEENKPEQEEEIIEEKIEENEPKEEIIEEKEPEVPKAWEAKKEEIKQAKQESKKIESIFGEEETKQDSEFLTEIKNFLKQKDIEFLEEVRSEKREVMAIVKITSQLGDIQFLLIAKNKKTLSKDEIEAAAQMATRNSKPCLLLIRREPSKAIQKLIDENDLLKIEILE
jgi:hypothetical protein